MPIIRRVRPVRNKNVVNVEDDERRPARRQAEGKASNKIKATAGPSGVIDRLAPFHPFATLSRARLYALRGGWRPFLLSFNLTFPANGQPGVNSTALIATRQSPTGSVRATERTRGPVHPPSFGVSRAFSCKQRFSTLLRVFFDPPQHSFPRLPTIASSPRHDLWGCLFPCCKRVS